METQINCMEVTEKLASIIRKAIHHAGEHLIIPDELHNFVSKDRVLYALSRASLYVAKLYEETDNKEVREEIVKNYNNLLETFMNKCLTEENVKALASLIVVPDKFNVEEWGQ